MKVMGAAAMAMALLFASASVAAAGNDRPGADWMPKDEIVKKLEAAGYSNVTGLKADDGYWEGKAVKNGQITEIRVDPHSGALANEEVGVDVD